MVRLITPGWRSWSIPAIVAVAVGSGLLWFRSSRIQAAAEWQEARRQAEVRAVLRQEHAQLSAHAASESELAELRADHAALGRLRAEVAALRTAADARARSRAEATTLPESAAEWREVGTAHPAAALQTLLWAMTHGQFEALTRELTVEAGARAEAEQLFATLPESARARYATLESWLASRTAGGVAPTRGRMVTLAATGTDRAEVMIELFSAGATLETARSRTVTLTAQRRGEGWAFLVPIESIRHYARVSTVP